MWDVTQSQVSVEMREHERRVWSVDFAADPKLLASGSDDGSVKLWNINQVIIFWVNFIDRPSGLEYLYIYSCRSIYVCIDNSLSYYCCRDRVLVPLRQRPMSVVLSSWLIIVIFWHLVRQIIEYITMICAIWVYHFPHWFDTRNRQLH